MHIDPLMTHQPIELSATGNKLLPEVLGVPVLEPDGTLPIWLLEGKSDVELPELLSGGVPPFKAF